MGDAISDTGPLLHLHQVGWQTALAVFERLIMPDLVAEELRARQLDPGQMAIQGLALAVVPVPAEHWQHVLRDPQAQGIHPFDAQVFALAEANRFQQPVLTDDLALRRHLQAHGATVVGSIGVLVRAYNTGQLRRDQLQEAVDALFDRSTLYLSQAFRAYVRQLLATLP